MSGLRKRKRSPVGDGSSQRVTRARAHGVHTRAGARTRAASRAQSPPATTVTPKQRQSAATAHAAPVVAESGAPTRRSARVQRSAPAQRGGRGRRRGSAVATGASRPPSANTSAATRGRTPRGARAPPDASERQGRKQAESDAAVVTPRHSVAHPRTRSRSRSASSKASSVKGGTRAANSRRSRQRKLAASLQAARAPQPHASAPASSTGAPAATRNGTTPDAAPPPPPSRPSAAADKAERRRRRMKARREEEALARRKETERKFVEGTAEEKCHDNACTMRSLPTGMHACPAPGCGAAMHGICGAEVEGDLFSRWCSKHAPRAAQRGSGGAAASASARNRTEKGNKGKGKGNKGQGKGNKGRGKGNKGKGKGNKGKGKGNQGNGEAEVQEGRVDHVGGGGGGDEGKAKGGKGKGKGGKKARQCARCRLLGHDTRTCPQSAPRRPLCKSCGQPGHNSRTCGSATSGGRVRSGGADHNSDSDDEAPEITHGWARNATTKPGEWYAGYIKSTLADFKDDVEAIVQQFDASRRNLGWNVSDRQDNVPEPRRFRGDPLGEMMQHWTELSQRGRDELAFFHKVFGSTLFTGQMLYRTNESIQRHNGRPGTGNVPLAHREVSADEMRAFLGIKVLSHVWVVHAGAHVSNTAPLPPQHRTGVHVAG